LPFLPRSAITPAFHRPAEQGLPWRRIVLNSALRITGHPAALP
jgi:hypothetical protein